MYQYQSGKKNNVSGPQKIFVDEVGGFVVSDALRILCIARTHGIFLW